MSKKQLKLLENGLCFIIQSIKNFKQSEKDIRNSEKELKYSCICLFSGVFLILKEKLSQEHWSLLFSDVNKANKKDLKTGNFHSVNFSDCRKRLSEIVSIEFTKKENKMLDSLREKRNKIEHFFESESLISFKPTLACNLSFALSFIDKYLKSNLSGDYEKDMETIKNECSELSEFVKQKFLSIKPELENQKVILYCSQCNQEAIVPCGDDRNELKCLFCHRIINSDDELDKIYYDSLGVIRSKDYLSGDATFCGECEAENSLVDTKNKTEFFCLRCRYIGKKNHLQQCGYCGVYYENKNEDSFLASCITCQENIFSRSD